MSQPDDNPGTPAQPDIAAAPPFGPLPAEPTAPSDGGTPIAAASPVIPPETGPASSEAPSSPPPPPGPGQASYAVPLTQPAPARGPNDFAGGLGYAVDIVFVIDITGSMNPVLSQVKAGALSFHERLVQVMAAKDKHISSLRLRVVAYRDYLDKAEDALAQTPFFRLPEERHHFDAFVKGLKANGGGDEPESGLEGLGVALFSPWERGLDRRRHVVVLFTDASAHPIEAAVGQAIPGYPTALPTTFDGLTDLWDNPQGATMEFSAKRLLMYAPDVYPWNIISANWDNVLHYPSLAGSGLSELEFGQIVDAIAGSV